MTTALPQAVDNTLPLIVHCTEKKEGKDEMKWYLNTFPASLKATSKPAYLKAGGQQAILSQDMARTGWRDRGKQKPLKH